MFATKPLYEKCEISLACCACWSRIVVDQYDVCIPHCSLLVSGSDDLTAIVWDPLTRRQLASVPTGHTGNIFSVKVIYITNSIEI